MDHELTDRERALAALRQVIDPEIGENIVDLGLVERLELEAAWARLSLVLTSPTCPLGDAIADDAGRMLEQALPGRRIEVEQLEQPAWGPERLSAAARARLGWPDAPR